MTLPRLLLALLFLPALLAWSPPSQAGEGCCHHLDGHHAQCLALPGVAVTLRPGAKAGRELEEKLQHAAELVQEKYRISDRLWTSTAMTPEVTPGQPFILTYSFVPDGTPIEPVFPGESHEPSYLYSRMNEVFPGGEQQWKSLIRRALTSWGQHAPITYIEVPDDGAPIPGSRGTPGVRGDIRIAMHRINPPDTDEFLSYAYYPDFGDIVLDSLNAPDLYTPWDDFMLLTELIVHEHGHNLGLDHADPLNGTKIMEAFVGLGRYFPQEDDIRGVMFAYGDRFRPNQAPEDAVVLGMFPGNAPEQQTPAVARLEGAAIFREGEDDWYEFTMPEPGRLFFRAVPVGTVYPEGPENGPVVMLDALRVHDLGLELRGPPPGNLRLTVQQAPPGQPEVLQDVELEAGGPYRVRVFTTTGANATQRYAVEIGYRRQPDGPLLWIFR